MVESNLKILISIPVHECAQVIADQIDNIQHYVPNSIIVLHINPSFFETDSVDLFKNKNGVYINPNHVKISWGDVIEAHLSNYTYASCQFDFDYFIMHSSNDMYVKFGVEEYIAQYDAGFMFHPLFEKNTRWWPARLALQDEWLEAICSISGQNLVVASQVEGSFYKKEVADYIFDTIITARSKMSEKCQKYPREEIFFSTIGVSIVPLQKVGKPFVFSEVHRFDRKLWGKLSKRDRLYSSFFHYVIPRSLFDGMNRRLNDKMFKSDFYKTTVSVVNKVVEGDEKYFEENNYLFDGSVNYVLYEDSSKLFAAKRIKRNIRDPVRLYIRSLWS